VVKDDSTAEFRPVTLGQRQGDLVAVTDGVKAGERVIVAGQMLVAPGGKVRIEEAGAESAPGGQGKPANASKATGAANGEPSKGAGASGGQPNGTGASGGQPNGTGASGEPTNAAGPGSEQSKSTGAGAGAGQPKPTGAASGEPTKGTGANGEPSRATGASAGKDPQ